MNYQKITNNLLNELKKNIGLNSLSINQINNNQSHTKKHSSSKTKKNNNEKIIRNINSGIKNNKINGDKDYNKKYNIIIKNRDLSNNKKRQNSTNKKRENKK